jgi:hypothetical protein
MLCDCVTGVGSYLYLEANTGSNGEKAVLQSTVLNGMEGLCIQFWYSMYGPDIGNLTVIAQVSQGQRSQGHCYSRPLLSKERSWLLKEPMSLLLKVIAIKGVEVIAIKVDKVTPFEGVKVKTEYSLSFCQDIGCAVSAQFSQGRSGFRRVKVTRPKVVDLTPSCGSESAFRICSQSLEPSGRAG